MTIFFNHLNFRINETTQEASVISIDDKELRIPIEIPSSVTYENKEYPVTIIESRAFFESNITSVSLPSSLRIIKSIAFDRCRKTSGTLILPESLEVIEQYAFSSTRFTSIKIGKNVHTILSTAFCDNIALKRFIVDTANEYYCNDKYGCLYTKNLTVLIQFILSLSSKCLNKNTIQIGSKAMLGITDKLIYIPPHVIIFEYLAITSPSQAQEFHFQPETFQVISGDIFLFYSSSTRVYYYGSKIENNTLIESGTPQIYVSNKYQSTHFLGLPVIHLEHFPRYQFPTCRRSKCMNYHKYIFLFFFVLSIK